MSVAGSLPAGIEAVLFDLDNTLVDTRAVWNGAMTRTLDGCFERYPELRALGTPETLYERVLWPFAAERGAEVGGEWDDAFLGHALRRLLAEHATRDDRYADGLLEQYQRERESGSYELFPGVAATLTALAARFRLALVTNGPGTNQRSRIEPLGLDAYFAVIAVSGELGVRKPDRAIFAHVLKQLDVRPSAAVHIGDDLDADVGGAKAAGLSAVWVNRNGAEREHDADAVVTSLSQVPALLGVG